MLDITLFRENPDLIRADFDKRGLAHDRIDRVIELDKMVYEKQHENSQLRKQKNQAARGIGAAMKAGNKEEAERIKAEVADLGSKIDESDKAVNAALEERDSIRMSIPNILHDDVPIGEDESGNTVHMVSGENRSSILNLERTMTLSK